MTNTLAYSCATGVAPPSNFCLLRRAHQEEDLGELAHLHQVQLPRNVGKERVYIRDHAEHIIKGNGTNKLKKYAIYCWYGILSLYDKKRDELKKVCTCIMILYPLYN